MWYDLSQRECVGASVTSAVDKCAMCRSEVYIQIVMDISKNHCEDIAVAHFIIRGMVFSMYITCIFMSISNEIITGSGERSVGLGCFQPWRCWVRQ